MTTIAQPYLLVQGSTPIFEDGGGVRWLDRLWAIDAAEHMSAIADLRIASPLVRVEVGGANMVRVDGDERLLRIRFIPLPHARSRAEALLKLPRMFSALWRAIGDASIVHVGIAGWPYPLGWLAVPIARWRRRSTVVVVESAPWRLPPDQISGKAARLQSLVYEGLGRAVVRACDARFFTTKSYLDSLCGPGSARAQVIEATWVPGAQIISENELLNVQQRRRAQPTHPLKLAFFGRLAAEKGIGFLLDAFESQSTLRAVATLDVYGEGPLLAALQSRKAQQAAFSGVSFKGTLSYGPEFFQRLRDYDYIVVPSLSDEQPRIVYDAYSQGIPVLASATDGLRQCVKDGETGALFPPSSQTGLAACVAAAATPDGATQRQVQALTALQVARSMTHAAMHRTRAIRVLEMIESAHA